MLHLIRVRDRMAHGLIRKLFWVDTRDVLAAGLTTGGIDRLLLHSCSNGCKYVSRHHHEVHSTAFGSATKSAPAKEECQFEIDDAERARGQYDVLTTPIPQTPINTTTNNIASASLVVSPSIAFSNYYTSQWLCT